MTSTRRHALVVGGTGMLRGVSLRLLRTYDAVSVVARTASRLATLRIERREGIAAAHPICADWRDAVQLSAGLRQAVSAHGPIDLAVCWIHSTAPDAPFVILHALRPPRPSAAPRYFQIYGDRADSNQAVKKAWHARLAALPEIRYRRINLGRRLSKGRTRWLTDDEIAAGVIEAIETDSLETWVGDE